MDISSQSAAKTNDGVWFPFPCDNLLAVLPCSGQASVPATSPVPREAKYVGNCKEAKYSLQCLPQALISCLKNGSTFY